MLNIYEYIYILHIRCINNKYMYINIKYLKMKSVLTKSRF